jgi:predicted kinase
MTTKPLLVLVTGVPGSGKTTLARQLAEVLRLPILSKDVIKERLFDELGVADRGWSLKLGAAANELLWALAGECFGGAVIDTWLDPARDDAVRARAGLRAAGVLPAWEIMCECPGEVAVQRYAARKRHPGHMPPDPATLARIRRAAGQMAPLGLGPVLRVDTTQPVDAAGIVAALTSLDTHG